MCELWHVFFFFLIILVNKNGEIFCRYVNIIIYLQP